MEKTQPPSLAPGSRVRDAWYDQKNPLLQREDKSSGVPAGAWPAAGARGPALVSLSNFFALNVFSPALVSAGAHHTNDPTVLEHPQTSLDFP